MLNEAVRRRFWQKVDVGTDDECWNWRAYRDKDGYGTFAEPIGIRAQHRWRAHRFSWRITHGVIPEGMCVLHRCDNPSCVNPSHLWLGTAADNDRDRDGKGRGCCGERHPLAKLTRESARAIFNEAKSGAVLRRISKRFGVSERLVQKIARGLAWRSVNREARE